MTNLKGCYIGQNVRILEDISFFTKQNQLPGILLSIDFEKAFDIVASVEATLRSFPNFHK